MTHLTARLAVARATAHWCFPGCCSATDRRAIERDCDNDRLQDGLHWPETKENRPFVVTDIFTERWRWCVRKQRSQAAAPG